MALLTASRTAQSPLVAEFNWNFDDTMVNDAGATVDFGLTNIAETTFVIIPLPPGAQVTGGSLNVSEAFDAATYAVTIGDTADEDEYLTTADRKAVGTTALVPTGLVNTTGLNIVINITCADVCTTGLAKVVVEYIVEDRSCEVQIT
jgi:hypothetical protein